MQFTISELISIGAVCIAIGGIVFQVKSTKVKVETLEKEWAQRFETFTIKIFKELYPNPGEVLYLTEERHTLICRPFRDEVKLLFREHSDAAKELQKAVNELTAEVRILSERRETKRS